MKKIKIPKLRIYNRKDLHFMKKFLSIILTICLAFSVLTVGAASVSAAGDDDIALKAGSLIYFDNTYSQWDEVYFYAWNYGFFGDTYKMAPVAGKENLYKIVVPEDVPAGKNYFLFKSAEDWNGFQTSDQAAYANYNTYVALNNPTGKIYPVNMEYTNLPVGPEIIATPSSKQFTDPLTVTGYAFNTTDATYKVDDGEAVSFSGTVKIPVTTTTKITFAATGVEPQTYTYTKIENATVNVYVDGYTEDDNVYMYTFGGDRVGSEFVLMNNLGNGRYTATINGSAQVIFTTTNSWTTAKKFIIIDPVTLGPAENQEPLVSAGATVTFDLQAPATTA